MKRLLVIVSLLMLLMPFAVALPDVYDMLRGRQIIPEGGPWLKDNAKLYLGTDKDSYLQYNSTTAAAEISGITALVTTGATIASGEDLLFAGGNSIFDASLGSGIFKTTTGAVTIGPGATGMTGALTIANLAAITAGSSAAGYDLSASTGAFTTSTGTNTLSGNTVIAGSKTFATGTGAVGINGDVTIAATKGITKTAGAGNFDFSAGTGTFLTPTGQNTLSGNVVVTSGKNVTMAGASTFTSGTGLSTLGGIGIVTGTLYANSTIVHAGDDITYAAGDGIFDAYLGTGIFNTTSGTNTFNGNVVIAGSKTLSTGTGAVTLSGPVGIASGIDVVAAGGASDLDYSLSSGFLKTPTGAVTVKGHMSIDTAKTLTKGTTFDRVLAKTADYTVTDTDPDIIFVGAITALAHATVTLPTAADNTGREITVIVAGDPGANNVVLDGEGGELINGAETKTNSDLYSFIKARCSGTAWFITGSSGTWS